MNTVGNCQTQVPRASAASVRIRGSVIAITMNKDGFETVLHLDLAGVTVVVASSRLRWIAASLSLFFPSASFSLELLGQSS